MNPAPPVTTSRRIDASFNTVLGYISVVPKGPLLILGAGGCVGTELTRLCAERRLACAGRTHSQCDITNSADVERALRAGERVRADAERRVQPTWARAIADQTLALVAGTDYGLYHVMCHGETTWTDFGREMARLAGCDPRLIEGVPSSALPSPAARPR